MILKSLVGISWYKFQMKSNEIMKLSSFIFFKIEIDDLDDIVIILLGNNRKRKSVNNKNIWRRKDNSLNKHSQSINGWYCRHKL